MLTKEAAYIDIEISSKKRAITIYDNAVGISKDLFAKKLLSIADSDKDRNEDKGFRGIGRLAVNFIEQLKRVKAANQLMVFLKSCPVGLW